MTLKPEAHKPSHLTPDCAIDFSEQVRRLHRIAEEYRTLADGAHSDGARKSYEGMAHDYEDLAKVAEETVTSSRTRGPAEKGTSE